MSYNKELNPMQALTESMTPKFAVSYLRVSTRGQAERGGGRRRRLFHPRSARGEQEESPLHGSHDWERICRPRRIGQIR